MYQTDEQKGLEIKVGDKNKKYSCICVEIFKRFKREMVTQSFSSFESFPSTFDWSKVFVSLMSSISFQFDDLANASSWMWNIIAVRKLIECWICWFHLINKRWNGWCVHSFDASNHPIHQQKLHIYRIYLSASRSRRQNQFHQGKKIETEILYWTLKNRNLQSRVPSVTFRFEYVLTTNTIQWLNLRFSLINTEISLKSTNTS